MKWILRNRDLFKEWSGVFYDGWMNGCNDPETDILAHMFCIGVGDYTCTEYESILGATITDGKTHRMDTDTIVYGSSVSVANIPGEVGAGLFNAVTDMFVRRNGGSTHIIVDGEEDLAVLPVILMGDNGDVVMWGNPFLNRTEYIIISPEWKRKVLSLMASCGEWSE